MTPRQQSQRCARRARWCEQVRDVLAWTVRVAEWLHVEASVRGMEWREREAAAGGVATGPRGLRP